MHNLFRKGQDVKTIFLTSTAKNLTVELLKIAQVKPPLTHTLWGL
jgi:hypothetical protein